MSSPSKNSIKVFVSHAHGDHNVAQLLLDFLLTEFDLQPADIRCTSAHDEGHILELGKTIVDQLQEDIEYASLFIGLFSYFGLASAWVKFEMGAAWGKKKVTLPLIGPGFHSQDERLGPLAHMPSLMVTNSQFDSLLLANLRKQLTKLNIRSLNHLDTPAKLNSFTNAYRRFGGINADFKKTHIHLSQPEDGGTVKQIVQIEIDVSDAPEDGFLWVGTMMTTGEKLMWPKEIVRRPYAGFHAIEVAENGTPPPGELGVFVLGVGMAGNAYLENWRDTAEKTGSWPGLTEGKIPGAKLLVKVGNLTLKRE